MLGEMFCVRCIGVIIGNTYTAGELCAVGGHYTSFECLKAAKSSVIGTSVHEPMRSLMTRYTGVVEA